MSTHSNAPTSSWNLPAVNPWAVLATTVVVVALGWWVLAPGPDARLTPEDVDGPWPFAAQEAAVYCLSGSPSIELDGVRYALADGLRSRPELATFDLDMPDDVWLRRESGTKVSLGPVTEEATRVCNAG